MDEEEARQQLRDEDFTVLYIIRDSPGQTYGNHTHKKLTAHIILKGEMELTTEGKAATYKKGDRVDVPAGQIHSARMGEEGCVYLVGEKSA